MKRLAITFVLALLASVPIALVWRDQRLGVVIHLVAFSALIFAFFLTDRPAGRKAAGADDDAAAG